MKSAILAGSMYYAMLGMIMEGMSFRDMEGMPRGLTKDEINALRQIRDDKIAELKRKGLQSFEFGEMTVYALNRKNAERKYRNFINNQKTKSHGNVSH